MQYWLGPFLGSLVGAIFYSLLKQYVSPLPPPRQPADLAPPPFLCSYRYWTLNPDQATSDARKSPADPFVHARDLVRSRGPPSGASTGAGIDREKGGGDDSPV